MGDEVFCISIFNNMLLLYYEVIIRIEEYKNNQQVR